MKETVDHRQVDRWSIRAEALVQCGVVVVAVVFVVVQRRERELEKERGGARRRRRTYQLNKIARAGREICQGRECCVGDGERDGVHIFARVAVVDLHSGLRLAHNLGLGERRVDCLCFELHKSVVGKVVL